MRDYFINEGNKIGYTPTAFDANLNLQAKKLTASAAIEKGQLVKISGDMTVAPATALTDAVIGVAMFDYKSGDEVVVETEGLVYLTAGGTITAGDFVGAAADGKCAKVTSASTDRHVGIAISSAVANGACIVKLSL